MNESLVSRDQSQTEGEKPDEVDPDRRVRAPVRRSLAKLGVELNKTYLPYGRMGQAGLMRQSAQDANASQASPGVLAARSVSKGNPVYCNDGWDLVDAIKNGKCKLEDVEDEDLPEDLRKLDPAARKSKVDEAVKRRATIQAQILELNNEREKFLAAERQKQIGTKADTLDRAIVKAIRDQAGRQDFQFDQVSP